jgi:hypothetical protein
MLNVQDDPSVVRDVIRVLGTLQELVLVTKIKIKSVSIARVEVFRV